MPSVIKALLDSSSVLAFIRGEPHSLDEDQVLAVAGISSVNLAEVIGVLLAKGVPDERIALAIDRLGLKVVPLEGEAAALAGRLIPRGRPLNIGLGDCACIATGIVLGVPIYTGDPDWLQLEVDADIKLIR